MNISIEIIGVLAGVLTTGSFIPQAIKIWKTKDVEAISLQMYVIFTIGMCLWLTYGILIEKFAVIAANCVGLVLCAFVIVGKIRFEKK